MSYLRRNGQLFTSRSVTWLKDQNIVIAVISSVEELHFKCQEDSSMDNIQNFNMGLYINYTESGLLRSGSVHEFKTVSLSFLVAFPTNFDAILFVLIYWNEPELTSNRSDIQMKTKAQKGQDKSMIFVPRPVLGYWKRRSFVLRNFMKVITLRLVCGFLIFPLLSAFIKDTSFCLCFRLSNFVE